MLAPTGRASKRMSEVTNFEASTIHRFLKWNKDTNRFQINEYNGLWKIGSANHNNILKLITLSYDKPFGMERKYKEIRKTFNDYNNSALFTD